MRAEAAPAGGDLRAGPDVPIIEVQDLGRVFHPGQAEVHALREVDLRVGAGEFVAVMGSSGSGKSTLMNILGCLDRPTQGRYLLAGRDVAELGRAEQARVRNRDIGFVFQSFHLLPRVPAVRNVELPLSYAGVGRRERRQRAMAALESVGVADRAWHRPSELSGGQQQRVAVARALVTQPRLLLADEPTGNLDSTSTRDVLQLFAALHAAGRTLVVITHEPDVAAWAERTVVLSDGRIVSDTRHTPHRELS